MMMQTPKMVGLMTSRVASKTTSKRSPHGEQALAVMLLFREPAHAVLDDDDRAIDDDAEVERAQAHEVAADFAFDHAGDGEEHRQRNDRSGDERRADVSEQQKEHDDDEHRALEEVLPHRLDRGIDERRPVVDGVGYDALRAGCG